MSLRKTLEQASRGRKTKIPDLIGPMIPPRAAHILSWFWRISNRRSYEMGLGSVAPRPISIETIDAWVRLSGEEPEAWEIRTIERLDDAFLSASAKG